MSMEGGGFYRLLIEELSSEKPVLALIQSEQIALYGRKLGRSE